MKNKGWKRQEPVPGAVLFGIGFCLVWIWTGSCAMSGAAAAYGAENLPDRTEEAQPAETLTLEGPVFTDADRPRSWRRSWSGMESSTGSFPGGSARPAREGP